MEHELLDEVRKLRKELREAMGSCDEKRCFRDEVQETRTELAMLYEELAKVQVRQERCGCGCCAEGARAYANLEVSRHRLKIRSCLTYSREEEV